MQPLLLLVWLAVAPGTAEAPRLELEAERQLVLTALPPVFADAAVEEHLTTGLTTSFAFRVTVRDERGVKVQGAARVDVRYELWDEIFHVAAVGLDGQVAQDTLPSLTGLGEWWRALRLVVATAEGSSEIGPGTASLAGAGPWQVRVVLEVVPFSQAEQRDTQRWFSDAIDEAAKSTSAEVASGADKRGGEPLSRVFNLLLATSIERPALFTYRWNVTLPEGATS